MYKECQESDIQLLDSTKGSSDESGFTWPGRHQLGPAFCDFEHILRLHFDRLPGQDKGNQLHLLQVAFPCHCSQGQSCTDPVQPVQALSNPGWL
jgi:hypothetical protein